MSSAHCGGTIEMNVCAGCESKNVGTNKGDESYSVLKQQRETVSDAGLTDRNTVHVPLLSAIAAWI